MYNFRTLFNRFSLNSLLAVVVVVFVLLPLIIILIKSTSLSFESWALLWENSIVGLLWKTIKLASLVAIFTIVLGVSSAWLLTRRRFSGSTWLVWLMVLPLAIPTYVYADIYINLLSNAGWLSGIATFWAWLVGDSVWLTGVTDLLSVAFILSLASFSYVFLLVRVSLRKSTRTLEEAARMQGANSRGVFWRVNVPMLRPAIAASMAIVVLHTISDFGAVNILEYRTFTTLIYLYHDSEGGPGRSAALSMVVVVMAMTFLIVERFFRSKQKYYGSDIDLEDSQIRPVAGWKKIAVWLWIGAIIFFAVVLPVGWLVMKTIVGFINGEIGSELWSNAASSFLVAAAAATVALFAGFPIAYYFSRRKSILSVICLHSSNVGFILPGPIIALGVLMIGGLIFNDGVPGSAILFLWIIAVSIRYLPLAVQAQESLLQQLTPSMERAGRILGSTSWQNLKRVILPVIKPGMISAWVLVFIDALKELPAALLMKVEDVTTLPVMIWQQYDEDFATASAAPASLMLVIATLPAIWLMMRGQRVRNTS